MGHHTIANTHSGMPSPSSSFDAPLGYSLSLPPSIFWAGLRTLLGSLYALRLSLASSELILYEIYKTAPDATSCSEHGHLPDIASASENARPYHTLPFLRRFERIGAWGDVWGWWNFRGVELRGVGWKLEGYCMRGSAFLIAAALAAGGVEGGGGGGVPECLAPSSLSRFSGGRGLGGPLLGFCGAGRFQRWGPARRPSGGKCELRMADGVRDWMDSQGMKVATFSSLGGSGWSRQYV
eukprot:766453-Hanusia_phi.AAC.3